VLGAQEDGEIYTWNEFYLKDDSGHEATLTWEQTEEGISWKLFQYFEPGTPLDYAKASRIKLGDRVNIDGLEAKVDYVGESQVYLIEGEAPEGVQLGDKARYFNAWLGNNQLVVSWTGNEVEHFLGDVLSERQVARAYGVSMPAPASAGSYVSAQSRGVFGSFPIKTFLVGILALCAIVFYVLAPGSCASSGKGSGRVQTAPAASYGVGALESFLGNDYRIESRALVECARADGTHFCRLYVLKRSDGALLRLIQGTDQARDEWLVLKEETAPADFLPGELGSFKVGNLLPYGTLSYQVRRLQRFRLVSYEGGKPDGFVSGAFRYGFFAQETGGSTLLFDWDAASVRVSECRVYPDAVFRKMLTERGK
jgi:hypothetical protein